MLHLTVAPVWWGNEPAWLRHGAAEFHKTLSLSQAGLISDTSTRGFRQQYVNDATRTRNHLANLEADQEFISHGGAYEHAFLASEVLASIAGVDALLRFFEHVQLGKSWKTIFHEVFDMTVMEFYDVFDIFRNADFPAVSVPVNRTTPASEPRYSITNATKEYGYEIDLPRGWVEENGRIKSSPGGELFITGINLAPGTTLDSYAETVTDNLRQDWWLTASRFRINEVDKIRIDGNGFYFVEYVVQESPRYCALDVWELIAVGSSLPQSSKGYRVRHQLCEGEAREWRSRGLDKTRRETLESFRLTTRPATYYRQFIDVEGIIVKANEMVEVASMYNSADVIKVMMDRLRDDIERCMVTKGAAMAISPFDELITTLPEFYPQKGELDYAGGLGAVKGQPVSGSIETGIMMGSYSIVLHEFAHAIQNLCFTEDEQAEWVEFYEKTKKTGVFPDAYGMTDDNEFFAEFSISFFEQSYQPQWRWTLGGDELTRQQLADAYPEIFAFLGEIYPEYEVEP